MFRKFLFALALIALPSLAQAETGRVIGDSLGVGVDWAAKLPSTAKNSVAIYSGAILEQLRQAQKGETVFLSLGTNDAIGNALDVRAHVDQIVAMADSLGVHLVWMGPPCVLKPWNAYSKKLDEILAAQLKGTSVNYVSMQGPEFCDPSVHAAEGVHFSMAGYTRMWQKARAAVDFPETVAGTSAAKTAAAENRKPRVHKRRHKKHAQATTTEKTTPEPK